MTKDRLEDFRNLAIDGGAVEDNEEGETIALRNHVSANQHTSFREKRGSARHKHVIVEAEPETPYLNEFFKQLQEVHLMIESLKVKVDNTDRLHTAIISSPHSDERTKDQLDQIVADIKKVSSDIRLKMKAIETSMAEDKTIKELSAEWRIRKTQHAATLHRFNNIMSTYHAYQVDYREKCKARILRQLDIAGKSMSVAELEDALETGDPAVFTQGFIIQTQQARQSLKDIEARHHDIIKLEGSIKEVKEMFDDIARLVESQGEMIDVIEVNVQQAVDFTESAKEQTGKALVYQKKARKKKIIIIICVVISLIILALILGLSIGLR